MNAFDQIRDAITQAKSQQNAVAANASTLSELLAGNLRHCPHPTLCRLKAELKAFNIQTGRWRNPK